MTNDPSPKRENNRQEVISEDERRTALDIFGQLLMDTRDTAIIQWDQIIAGKRQYAPWNRIVNGSGAFNIHSLEIIKAVLPHVVDTVIYCLLAELDANRRIRVSVDLNDKQIRDVARLSDGLPAEPVGNDGWLTRFAKQRFEQPM